VPAHQKFDRLSFVDNRMPSSKPAAQLGAQAQCGVCGHSRLGAVSGVPNPCCRQCAFSACYAYQISANTKQKRSLT